LVLNGISFSVGIGVIFSLMWGLLAGVISGVFAGIAWAAVIGIFFNTQSRKEQGARSENDRREIE